MMMTMMTMVESVDVRRAHRLRHRRRRRARRVLLRLRLVSDCVVDVCVLTLVAVARPVLLCAREQCKYKVRPERRWGYRGCVVADLYSWRKMKLDILGHALVDGRRYICQNCVRRLDENMLPSAEQERADAGTLCVVSSWQCDVLTRV